MLRVLIDDFKGWNVLEYLWGTIAITVGVVLSAIWNASALDMIAMVTSVVCVLLIAKGKVSNFIWGIIGVSTYGYLSYRHGVYGDAMFKLGYNLPMQFIGLYLWSKNMSDGTVKERALSWKQRLSGIVFIVITVDMFRYILIALHGKVVIWDATSTVLAFVAMMLLVKGYMEQWMLWIIVNGVSLGIWIKLAMGGDLNVSMLVMWSTFLINSLWGFYTWRKNVGKIKYTINDNHKLAD